MARLVAAALAVGVAFALRADGDSGDALKTPDNGATTTKVFTGSSDTLDRNGWYSTVRDNGGCYARRDGVGLRKGEASALRKDFDAPETISYVAVTVSAATSSAVGKSLQLSLRLRDDLEPVSRTFSFDGATSTPKTLTFSFPEGVEAAYVSLTNPGGNIFEVGRVVWKRRAPGIEGTLTAPASTEAGKPFHCSLSALSGGSGTYVRARFDFAGQSETLEPAEPGRVVSFVAPSEDGDWPLTVTVEDDLGTAATLTQTIHVVAYAPPRNLRTTEVSRSGFTLEWDRPVLLPEEYHVVLREEGKTETRFRPGWVADSEGRFATKAPLAPVEGELILALPGWEGNALEWSDDGATWNSAMNLSGLWFPDGWKGDRSALWLRATAAEAPTSVQVTQTVTRVYEQHVKDADGQRCVATFTGLPAGRALEVVVSANYGTIEVEATPLKVTLEAIPPFVKGTWADGCATLTWPEGVEGLEAEMVIRAEREVPHALPPGLYLTRTCYTRKASGFETTGKGIVLTNTSAQDIPLDGKTYTFRSQKEGSSPNDWDFRVRNGKEVSYPHVVPAGGELVFSHYKYKIPELDLHADAKTAGEDTINFTPDYTLTLLRNGEPVNSLGCATNAVRRLREDTLEAYDDHALVADSLDMSPFYDAWTIPFEEEIHATMPFSPIPGNRQSYLCFNPKGLVQDLESLRRIWADFVILDGSSRSAPLTLELWRRDSPKPKRGFALRLR